jgi:hypothetical protein
MRKTMQRTMNTTGFLGEHLSMREYNDKYEKNPNIEEIRGTLKLQTNSQSIHEVTLRNAYNEDLNRTVSLEKGWYKYSLKKKEDLHTFSKERLEKVKRRMDYMPNIHEGRKKPTQQ